MKILSHGKQDVSCFFSDKLLNILKITTFLLFMLICGVSALNSYSQTNALQKITLEEVLDYIQKEEGYSFWYRNDEVDLGKNVSIDMENKSMIDVLDKLLSEQNLAYTINDKHIVIYKKNGQTAGSGIASTGPTQQTRRISGVIVDEQNIPIIGANVLEKGTLNGTVSDLNGNFILEINSNNAALLVTYVGYNPVEVPVGNSNNLNIKMQEDTKALDEVVVVGYGTQKKINLTGSVTSVAFDEEMENRPITNASQALAGKVPGLWVSQNSGQPGSDEIQLRVRGWGTLNNTDPLVIIDGVEGEFSQINPNDIESIAVLKDASSAAIYGSKAANGVVLITTKMGSKREQLQINLSSYVGIQTLDRRYNLINNSAENMQMINFALINGGSSPLFPDYLISAFQNETDKYKYPNTDWFETFFDSALLHEHNLSIRSGTEKSTSFLSFNYLSQEGIVPNTESYRFSIRANIDYEVNNWLKVGGRISYMNRKTEEPYTLTRVYDMLRGAAPYVAPYTRDGRFGSAEAIDEKGIMLYDNRNPFIDAANGKRLISGNYVTANTFADISFMKNLILKTTFSTNARFNLIDRHNESIYGYTDSGMETITRNYNRDGIEMSRTQITSVQNNFYATLNYNQRFGKHHDISAIIGSQLESFSTKNVFARRANPPKEGLTQVDAGTGGIQGEGNLIGLRMFSYFGRLNYSFEDKYLFEANLRADASSRFKKENRWGYFPGFSVGWRIGEEDFIRKLDVFSNLKLRASWGQLGNQNVSGFWPYLTVIDQSNNLSYSYNGSFSPGAAVTSLIDENITWETASTLDIGLDVGLLNNRLNIEADYFNKKTSDIIVQLPIPLTLGGLTAPYENVGEMVNKGFELSVNYGSKVGNNGDFGYNIGVNFTYIDNEVTKFRGESPDQLFLIREGYSYQSLYGYKVTGIYQTDEEAVLHMHSNSYKPGAGDLKFEDINQDGKLGFEDKQVLGNTIPKMTYGITANFNYKNFDLNLLFQGVKGTYLYNQNQYTRMELETLTIVDSWRDAWTPENTNTDIPKLKLNDTSWTNTENSFWVKRGDFLKLKNIQLGYLVPKSIISKLKLEKLYLYANVQNVFTIITHKGYEGFDPERGTSGNGGDLYPTPRIMTFGINLNF
jgi:TonB-linked SusC/RagA family outer membrane protein